MEDAAGARVELNAASVSSLRAAPRRARRRSEEEEDARATSEFALRSVRARAGLPRRRGREVLFRVATLLFPPRAITPLVSDFRARGLPRNERWSSHQLCIAQEDAGEAREIHAMGSPNCCPPRSTCKLGTLRRIFRLRSPRWGSPRGVCYAARDARVIPLPASILVKMRPGMESPL